MNKFHRLIDGMEFKIIAREAEGTQGFIRQFFKQAINSNNAKSNLGG